MTIKLLTEHHLEFLSLKGGCTGLYESTLVKIPHCWKSQVMAHFVLILICLLAEAFLNEQFNKHSVPRMAVPSSISNNGYT